MYILTEITDVGGSEFDSLFSSSLYHMDAGTFSWGFLDNPQTEEEKRESMRSKFYHILDKTKILNGVGLLWKKDDVPIHLAIGVFNSFDSNYLTFIYALYGPDANGSKSWLHDEDYLTITKDFFVSQYGIVGYKINCINNSTIMNYHLNKPQNLYDITVDDVYSTANGIDLAKISYTYK